VQRQADDHKVRLHLKEALALLEKPEDIP